MIERRHFETDLATGVVTTFCFDHDTETVTFEKSQNVDPLIDLNKRNLLVTPDNWKGELHQVGSIPMIIYADLKKQGIIDDPKRLARWLNDSDNRVFRTKAGYIG